MTSFLLPLEWAGRGQKPAGQVNTRILIILAISVIQLDTSNFGKLVRLLSPNRHCFVLVCHPLRPKSSASSATVTSSSFTARWSTLPTMESLPVRLFFVFHLSHCQLLPDGGFTSEKVAGESVCPTGSLF